MSATIQINLIVAAAENGGIGWNNRLPWHLPADLRHFRLLTTGHVLIMGRRTWESLPGPLPNRHSVVISGGNTVTQTTDCTPVGSFDQALEAVAARGCAEVFVTGGASVYEQALPCADRIYLTRVHCNTAADTFFPALPAALWEEIQQESHPADPRNPYAYTFLIYTRRVKTSAAEAPDQGR